MLHARLAFSYEMQPGTDQTGPAGRLSGPSAAERREEVEGRGRYKEGWVGEAWGVVQGLSSSQGV